MKQKEMKLTDMPHEILKLIMMFVAQTSNGAVAFLRATSCCKDWNEFGKDEEILKVVKFGMIYWLYDSFWSENGFLSMCNNAGNKNASAIMSRKDMLRKLKLKKERAPKNPMDYDDVDRNPLRRTDSMFFHVDDHM